MWSANGKGDDIMREPKLTNQQTIMYDGDPRVCSTAKISCL